MAAPIIYVSDEAQRILDRKKAPQAHHYHVRVNTCDAAGGNLSRRAQQQTVYQREDANASPDRGETKSNNSGVHHHHVTVNVGGEPARKLGQYESSGSPDEGGVTQEGVKSGNAAKGVEETGTGRKGGADNPFDLILGYLRKLDARLTALERGPGAAKEEEQRPPAYADARRRALAESAHGLGPAPPLKANEARSMQSPQRGPQSPLKDRWQRGEERPRELIDKYPRGDPYRANGVSSAPDAPAPPGGNGRERAINRTTGATKFAYNGAPTGDGAGAPSTGDLIRGLARKENQMMREIRDEIAAVIKSRWH